MNRIFLLPGGVGNVLGNSPGCIESGPFEDGEQKIDS